MFCRIESPLRKYLKTTLVLQKVMIVRLKYPVYLFFKSNKTDGLHEMIKIFLKLIQNIYDSQYFALFIKFNEIT